MALRKDLEDMKDYALIVSPFLNKFAVEKFCNLREVGEALLYFVLRLGERDFESLYEYDLLPRLCGFIFQLRADSKAIKRAWKNLLHVTSFSIPSITSCSQTFYKLVESLRPELETCLPKIEVRVVWPST